MAVNKIHLMTAKEVLKLRRRHNKVLAKIVDRLNEKYVTGKDGEEALLNSVSEDERDDVRALVLKIDADAEAKQFSLPGVDPTVNTEDTFVL